MKRMRRLRMSDQRRLVAVLGFALCFVFFAQRATAAEPSAGSPLFHKPGLIYFWALNDACTDVKMDAMIDAFAKGGVSAVCLMPFPGLLKPYGGDAWFAMVKRGQPLCGEEPRRLALR